jgi:hypothetical protein
VIADLDTLRTRLGQRSQADDAILAGDLESATVWVYDRVYREHRSDASVQMAILILAGRLYKRRLTPDGIAGWSADGVVARIGARDPDVTSLLARHLDMTRAGVA